MSAVKLNGWTEYNTKFPPRNAKKGYVAKISGRVPGAAQFNRTFLGESVIVDEAGLYEIQTGLKKGGCTQTYRVVLEISEGEFKYSFDIGRENALAIAKRLGAGEKIDSIVKLIPKQSTMDPSATIYTCEIISKAAAAKEAAAASIESAIDQCAAILGALSEAEIKKVLAGIKTKLIPAKAKPAKEEAKESTEAKPE